jgi:hypothetical protein
MATPPVLPASDEQYSALSSFLRRTVTYGPKAVIPRDLLQFGFLGASVVIATGLLAFAVPTPAAIAHGHFFWVLGGFAADLAACLHTLAVPAILCGLGLLGLDFYLMQVPTSERSRPAVVAQAVAGGASAALGTVFLALLLFNLMIWIALIVGAVALLCGVLVVTTNL